MSENQEKTLLDISEKEAEKEVEKEVEKETECPGGVCPIPIKKQISPQTDGDNTPKMDDLFSNLISSVLGNNDNFSKILKNVLPQNKGSGSESESESDNESEDDGDEDDGDEDECSYTECLNSSIKWKAFNILLESHVNLTRALLISLKND